ncbi:MAG: type 1 glutamine amidotransferase [Bacteroidales bacterium]|nr:type 1 glutamine amidotransferase [Bacteroidales bacterium]MCB9013923.1 type 1 glutamine amidotransferase [Bacteroidales bacterium]
MIIQIFQHVSYEGPAYIEEIIEASGNDIHICRFDEGELPMPATDYDMLIIMGGPMNIYEESEYPWLVAEKRAIDQAIKSDKVVFGFCLGAQLIADALGARVYKNAEKEIGWYPVSRINPGDGNPPLHFLPDIATVFHWHGETFDIPKNAVQLYRSEATENQGFLYESNVLALQFHPEMLKSSIEDLAHFCRSELTEDGKYIMSAEQMISDYKKYESSNKKMLRNIFHYFIKEMDL